MRSNKWLGVRVFSMRKPINPLRKSIYSKTVYPHAFELVNTRSVYPFRHCSVEMRKIGNARMTEAEGVVWKSLFQQIYPHNDRNKYIFTFGEEQNENVHVSNMQLLSFVQLGVYKHYKNGKEYRVIGHSYMNSGDVSSGLEVGWYVIYRSDDQEKNEFWARPLSMFKETIDDDDGSMNGTRRFTWLRPL